MASRRGFVITGVILAAITVASFTVWFIPQESGTVLVITDHEDQLDATVAIHGTLQKSLDEIYGMLQEGAISPAEYSESAERVSDQVRDQIITLASAEPPDEWSGSYSSYIESLRAFNSMIRETVVMADAIAAGDDTRTIEMRITELREISVAYAADSDSARP